MKKISLIALLMALSAIASLAQSAAPIEMEKVFGGYQFLQDGQRLNMKQLVSAMEPNTLAFEKISKAKSTYTGVMLLSVTGGVLIGWPIGTAIAGGDPNWVLAGVGAGLIVVSIPLAKKFNKQAREAVDLYNADLPTSSLGRRPELRLNIQGNGIGFALHF